MRVVVAAGLVAAVRVVRFTVFVVVFETGAEVVAGSVVVVVVSVVVGVASGVGAGSVVVEVDGGVAVTGCAS